MRRLRMSMRRFTRLTNGFSKKVENLKAAVSLHFAHFNFVRLHRTTRVTPAIAAVVSDTVWSLKELVGLTNMNWRAVATCLALSVSAADAQSQEIKAQILPNGRLQFYVGGPELDSRQFLHQLRKLRHDNGANDVHLYTRSMAAFSHLPEVHKLLEKAGFLVDAID
jgi:hypothetical protein